MQIQIINNEERVRKIQVSRYGDPYVEIVLLPGANLVKKDHWEAAKKINGTKLLLKERIAPSPAPEAAKEKVGQPVIVEGAELPDEAPIKALKPAAAISMISETFDARLLKQWLDVEERPQIEREIKKQLDRVLAPSERKGAPGTTTPVG